MCLPDCKMFILMYLLFSSWQLKHDSCFYGSVWETHSTWIKLGKDRDVLVLNTSMLTRDRMWSLFQYLTNFTIYTHCPPPPISSLWLRSSTWTQHFVMIIYTEIKLSLKQFWQNYLIIHKRTETELTLTALWSFGDSFGRCTDGEGAGQQGGWLEGYVVGHKLKIINILFKKNMQNRCRHSESNTYFQKNITRTVPKTAMKDKQVWVL